MIRLMLDHTLARVNLEAFLFNLNTIKIVVISALLLGPLAYPSTAQVTGASEVKSVGRTPSLIVSANQNRYEATAQLVSGSSPVTCSQTDSNVVTGQIRFNTATTTTLQSTLPLWCVSTDGGSFTFVYSTVSPFSTSERVTLTDATSTLIAQGNYSNRSSVYISDCSSNVITCGYTCPATESNNITLTDSNAFCGEKGYKFDGKTDICCYSDGTGDSVIAVVVERSSVNE